VGNTCFERELRDTTSSKSHARLSTAIRTRRPPAGYRTNVQYVARRQPPTTKVLLSGAARSVTVRAAPLRQRPRGHCDVRADVRSPEAVHRTRQTAATTSRTAVLASTPVSNRRRRSVAGSR